MFGYKTTLQNLIGSALKKHRDRVFGKFGEQTITYRDLDRYSNKVAHAIKELGYGIGDRAVFIMPNVVEAAIIMYALLKAGVTIVGLNIMLSGREISYILEDAGVQLAFIHPRFYDLISSIGAELPALKDIVAVGGEHPEGFVPWSNFMSDHPDTDHELNANPGDELLIAYTGGTTGAPKGVVHTQQNFFYDELAHCAEFNWQNDERFLLMTPLAHAAGPFIWAGTIKGATHVIEQQFDPLRVLKLVQEERITMILLVPTIMYVLLDTLKQSAFDISSLKTILYGASPIAEERLTEALAVFGPILYQFYGQTENPNLISTFTPFDHQKALEDSSLLQSCGRPITMVMLKIIDPTGSEVATGDIGEIAVKSPYMMKGYNNQPEATAEAFTADGWLLTGDMGRLDENGYLYIVDRRKDMIISGGMNVFSIEVEGVIQKHPKVKSVAVIGIPDDHWGEVVTAFVVPYEEVTPEEIVVFCKGKIADYMRPKKVYITDHIPLTPIGKANKAELRAPFWEGKSRKI